MYTMIAAVVPGLIVGITMPTASASNEGNPGGPRQIPGEDLGCHFPNPAGKVNTNPNACSSHEGDDVPPIPDCEASDNADSNTCRPSSGHFDN